MAYDASVFGATCADILYGVVIGHKQAILQPRYMEDCQIFGALFEALLFFVCGEFSA